MLREYSTLAPLWPTFHFRSVMLYQVLMIYCSCSKAYDNISWMTSSNIYESWYKSTAFPLPLCCHEHTRWNLQKRCRFFPAQFPTAAVSWSHRIEFLSSFFRKKLRHVDVQALRWTWPFGTHHLWTLRRTPGRFLWRNDGIWRIENDIPMISRWIRGECEQVFQKRLVFMTGEALHHYRHCGSKASCHWPSLTELRDLVRPHADAIYQKLFFFWKLGIAVACINSHQNISLFHIYYMF